MRKRKRDGASERAYNGRRGGRKRAIGGSAGRRGEAGYGEGVERERGEGSSAERAREGGVLVEIEDGGTRASFEYSRRCYARGYTYIYGRWCMVCHDGSNSGIPGLKLTSQ